jgi:SAM-dependent methyltransferase
MKSNNRGALQEEASFHDAVYDTDSIDRAQVKRLQSFDCPAGDFGERLPRLKSKLLEAVGDVCGKRVLVYGCGDDNAALWFAKHGARVDAIDISPKAIENQHILAALAGLNINAVVMNGNDLDLPSYSYDLVYGNAILHHLELAQAIPEMRRVLKPGGKAIFRDVMKGNLFLQAFRFMTPFLRTSREHPLTTGDLALFARGFTKCDIDHYMLTVLPFRFFVQAVNMGGLKRLRVKTRIPHPDTMYALFDRVDCVLFRLMPFLRTESWLCLVIWTR